MKRLLVLGLLVLACVLSIGATSTSAVVKDSYTDPSSGGQAACTWYNQGSLLVGTYWSWYNGVYAYRYGYHVCYTRYGTPAWIFYPK